MLYIFGLFFQVEHLEIFGIENFVATTSIPVLTNKDSLIEESFKNEISNKAKVISCLDFAFIISQHFYVFFSS